MTVWPSWHGGRQRRMKLLNDLVRFWDRCDLDTAPYVHPDDKPFIDAATRVKATNLPNHQAFMNHATFGAETDHSLHLSLLPVPYQGNLATANIFIVVLNPGLGLSDYQTQHDSQHADQIRKIIRQDFTGVPYPFLSLNPEYAWTGGFHWWQRKLHKVIRLLADDRFTGRYQDALDHLASRIAAIEVFPYHSKSFDAHQLLKKLPSAAAARTFLGTLMPRVARDEITVVATRAIKATGIADHAAANYDPKLVRSAPLSPGTPGGDAILRRLGLL